MIYFFCITSYLRFHHDRPEECGKIRSYRTFRQQLGIILLEKDKKLSQPPTKIPTFSLLPFQPTRIFIQGQRTVSNKMP